MPPDTSPLPQSRRMHNLLHRLDARLRDPVPDESVVGLRRFLIEFWYFGLKEARACLFVAMFFAAVFTVPADGVSGIPRYDALLLIAVMIQAWMLWARLET